MKAVKSEKRFLLPTDHVFFNSCHASTITKLRGGGLLAAFFAGSREGNGDVAIWLARTHGDAWLTPVRLA